MGHFLSRSMVDLEPVQNQFLGSETGTVNEKIEPEPEPVPRMRWDRVRV